MFGKPPVLAANPFGAPSGAAPTTNPFAAKLAGGPVFGQAPAAPSNPFNQFGQPSQPSPAPAPALAPAPAPQPAANPFGQPPAPPAAAPFGAPSTRESSPFGFGAPSAPSTNGFANGGAFAQPKPAFGALQPPATAPSPFSTSAPTANASPFTTSTPTPADQLAAKKAAAKRSVHFNNNPVSSVQAIPAAAKTKSPFGAAATPNSNTLARLTKNPSPPLTPNATTSQSEYTKKILAQLQKDNVVPPTWPADAGNPSKAPAMEALWSAYDGYRDKARDSLVRAGLIDDPNVRKKLNEAIDFKGICEDMCPDYEKVERIFQHNVMMAEKTEGRDGTMWATPDIMVKALTRSSAGQEAPLPMDVRTIAALRRTLDYLIDVVLAEDSRLPQVHAFLWDRTRAIRRDFIFHSTMSEDEMLGQIYCLEVITRLHVTVLHLLSKQGVAPQSFDQHQERVQLSKALLSLLQAYDDCRDRQIACANEAEFRAYFILLNAQDPNFQHRVSEWGMHLWYQSDEVQTAMTLAQTVQSVWDWRGPVRPAAPTTTALGAFATFFRIVEDPAVSYTMACFAESQFMHVRRGILRNMIKAYARMRDTPKDLTVGAINAMLRFDTRDEAWDFCELNGLAFSSTDRATAHLVLNNHPSISTEPLVQLFSQTLVERKRSGRPLPETLHSTVFERAGTGAGTVAVQADTPAPAQAPSDLFVSQSPAPAPTSASTSTSTSTPTAPPASSSFASLFGPTATAATPTPTPPAASPASLFGTAPPATSTPASSIFSSAPKTVTAPSFSFSSTDKSKSTTPDTSPAKPTTTSTLFGNTAPKTETLFGAAPASSAGPAASIFAPSTAKNSFSNLFSASTSSVPAPADAKPATAPAPAASSSLFTSAAAAFKPSPGPEPSAPSAPSLFSTTPATTATTASAAPATTSSLFSTTPAATHPAAPPSAPQLPSFVPAPAPAAATPPPPPPPPPTKADRMDGLTKWVVQGDHGILDEFTEGFIEYILKQTFDQFQHDEAVRIKDEEEAQSWADARKFQTYNLSVKFFYRWQRIARDRALDRRAREARDEYKAYRLAKRAEERRAAEQAAQEERERALAERRRGRKETKILEEMGYAEFAEAAQRRKALAETERLRSASVSATGERPDCDFVVPEKPMRALKNGIANTVSRAKNYVTNRIAKRRLDDGDTASISGESVHSMQSNVSRMSRNSMASTANADSVTYYRRSVPGKSRVHSIFTRLPSGTSPAPAPAAPPKKLTNFMKYGKLGGSGGASTGQTLRRSSLASLGASSLRRPATSTAVPGISISGSPAMSDRASLASSYGVGSHATSTFASSVHGPSVHGSGHGGHGRARSSYWRLRAMGMVQMPNKQYLHESLALPMLQDGKRFAGIGNYGLPPVAVADADSAALVAQQDEPVHVHTDDADMDDGSDDAHTETYAQEILRRTMRASDTTTTPGTSRKRLFASSDESLRASATTAGAADACVSLGAKKPRVEPTPAKPGEPAEVLSETDRIIQEMREAAAAMGEGDWFREQRELMEKGVSVWDT